jgi:hypothetical protein
LISDLDPVTPQWWQVALSPAGAATNIAPAERKQTQWLYYTRDIVAFSYVNDLLGGDDTASNAACAAYFKSWSTTFALGKEIAAAPTDVQPDADTIAAIRRAWATLPADVQKDERAPEVTRDTVRRLGPKPSIRVVYHDPGMPGDGLDLTIDIVQVGIAPHAYAIVATQKGKPPQIALRPVCIVGDLRCASEYIWP